MIKISKPGNPETIQAEDERLGITQEMIDAAEQEIQSALDDIDPARVEVLAAHALRAALRVRDAARIAASRAIDPR